MKCATEKVVMMAARKKTTSVLARFDDWKN
jgi:hypothetical protein